MLFMFAVSLYEKGCLFGFFFLPSCMKRCLGFFFFAALLHEKFFPLNGTISFQNNEDTSVLQFVYTGIWILLVFADKNCLVSRFLCCLSLHSSGSISVWLSNSSNTENEIFCNFLPVCVFTM